MNQIIALFFGVIATFSLGTSASPLDNPARQVNASSGEPLNVFLIHGLLGSPKSFCELNTVLSSIYGDKVRVVPLTYTTLSEDLRPYDFAQEIHDLIVQFYRENQLLRSAPYSFIVHSQGGIVALNYIVRCLIHHQCGPDTPSQLTHFISLGTPFWGSPAASRFSEAKTFFIGLFNLAKLFDFSGNLNGIPVIPKKQLEELSIASPTLLLDAEFLINSKSDSDGGWNNPLPPQIQVFNLGGDIAEAEDVMGAFENFLFKILQESIGDSDLVVPVWSSRMDIIFDVQGAELRVGRSQAIVKHIPVDLPHVPFSNLQGLACVKQKDLDRRRISASATSPALQFISSILSQYYGSSDLPVTAPGQKPNLYGVESDQVVQNVRDFMVQMQMILPQEYDRPLNIADDFIEVQGDGAIFAQLKSDNSLLSLSHRLINPHGRLNSRPYVTYHHQGRVNEAHGLRAHADSLPMMYPLTYHFKIPGWTVDQNYTSTAISPGHLTHKIIHLNPYLPIPGFDRKNGDQRLILDGTKFVVAAAETTEATSEDSAWESWTQSLEILFSGAEAFNIRLYWIDPSDPDQRLHTTVLNRNEYRKYQISTVNESTCYLARAGQHQGVHQGNVYSQVIDAEGDSQIGKLIYGDLLQVYGRHTVPEKNIDRYLVSPLYLLSSSEPSRSREALKNLWLGWVNVIDVDILQDRQCGTRLLP